MRITLYNKCCRVVTEEQDRKWRLEWNPRGSQKSKVHNPIIDIYSQAGLNRANRGKEGVVAKKKAWNHHKLLKNRGYLEFVGRACFMEPSEVGAPGVFSASSGLLT